MLQSKTDQNRTPAQDSNNPQGRPPQDGKCKRLHHTGLWAQLALHRLSRTHRISPSPCPEKEPSINENLPRSGLEVLHSTSNNANPSDFQDPLRWALLRDQEGDMGVGAVTWSVVPCHPHSRATMRNGWLPSCSPAASGGVPNEEHTCYGIFAHSPRMLEALQRQCPTLLPAVTICCHWVPAYFLFAISVVGSRS